MGGGDSQNTGLISWFVPHYPGRRDEVKDKGVMDEGVIWLDIWEDGRLPVARAGGQGHWLSHLVGPKDNSGSDSYSP